MSLFNKHNWGSLQKEVNKKDNFHEAVSINQSILKQNFYLKTLVLLFFISNVFVIFR